MEDNVIRPPLIADHPALDLLNTVNRVDGGPREFWRSDADVARWLRDTRMAPGATESAPAGLLKSALALREVIRDLVVQRKAGGSANPSSLNAYLEQAAGYPRLVWSPPQPPQLERVRCQETAEHWLAPLAESAAGLLVDGDFDRIKECEHPDCTLWFYDRAKSHRRRWCSMAVCGNRHKVSAFRLRQAG